MRCASSTTGLTFSSTLPAIAGGFPIAVTFGSVAVIFFDWRLLLNIWRTSLTSLSLSYLLHLTMGWRLFFRCALFWSALRNAHAQCTCHDFDRCRCSAMRNPIGVQFYRLVAGHL